MTERAEIDAFLASKRIAFVGVSTKEADFSRAVMRKLVEHGIDVVPVHPGVTEIERRSAFATVGEIPGRVDGALIMTPSNASAAVVDECAAAGIERVWLHRGVGRGSVSDEAIQRARDHGLSIVAGHCPLMFLEPNVQPHRAHATLHKLTGRHPDSAFGTHVVTTLLFAAIVWAFSVATMIAFHVDGPDRYSWPTLVAMLFAIWMLRSTRHPPTGPMRPGTSR